MIDRPGAHCRMFILCPPRTATGGPESLHLLAHTLRRLGHDANLVYVPRVPDPVHPDYAAYDAAIAAEVEDCASNLLIVPEIWTWRLAAYNHVRQAIWWLSVDNYLETGRRFDFARPGVRHLVASAYAERFLRASGVKRIEPLATCIHDLFVADSDSDAKADLVVYNPAKGFEVVQALMHIAPDVTWAPAAGMNREGIAALLRRSKVYVDFGHHPGRDRLPREAVIAGCCVITGMKGAAAFQEDVPVPPGYKFDDRDGLADDALSDVAATIRSCLADYERRRGHFSKYRERVRAETAAFEADVVRLAAGARERRPPASSR